ncbi:MAG: RagB/SusD family nutrient uptake outer membrane protein [Bacteroidales bacterium]|nr:RagB/SusD family nutrient uptake outer membrane protein [Bacteroidales bacterium]
MEVPPYGVYSQDQLVTKEAINNILIGCYSGLNGECNLHFDLMAGPTNMVHASIHAGDMMKGGPSKTDLSQWQEFNEWKVTAGNRFLIRYWQKMWECIYRCNFLLNQIEEATDELTAAEKAQIIAEARFLRAHYYFRLKVSWNNIPWIDETTDDVRVPNTVDNDGTTYVNIWPQIAADFDHARKTLPALQNDWGRPNKWAADAYYAKVQIFRASFGEYPAGYSEALTILNDIMANGVNHHGVKYGLQPNYYWNFSAVYDNSEESVFAIQTTVSDGINSTMPVFGKNPKANPEIKVLGLIAADGPGWGNGWGFYQPAQYFVDMFRTTATGLPFLDMYDTYSTSVTSDLGILSTEPFTPYAGELDPRLDWIVGRRGIPCLDYGIMPGQRWIRGPQVGGPYICKKWNIKDSEAGIYTYDRVNLANAINICIIRYADILLWAAECEAQVGSLDNARDLVNQVRNRMVQNSDSPDNWVKLDDGVTDAANYVIGLYPNDGSAEDAFTSKDDALTAILHERALELALEGHRFFDIIRFGKDEEIFPEWAAVMDEALPGQQIATYTYTRVPDMWCPIPTTAIDNSLKDGIPTLTQNPGY